MKGIWLEEKCESWQIEDKPVNRKNDVIIFLDSLGERAEEINRGLLVEGGRIADLLGGNLLAIAAESLECGLDAIADAAVGMLKDMPIRLLLFAHTDRGSLLAPAIAFHLETEAVLDCRDIRYAGGALHYVKHVQGGQLEQEISFRNSPEIATLNPGSLMIKEDISASPPEMKKLHARPHALSSKKKTTAIIPPDFRTIDIRFAKRILDIGSGCDWPNLLHLIEELSNLLQASIGTTRPLVDNKHIPKTRMIGKTGKTTTPELLLALGVSGSPHHVAGIRHSGTILSVNSDLRAPILSISNKGFVSDLNGLLPKLIRRIEQHRDENRP
jgi:electron transfer flavoprotein alpha subunit